METTIVVPDDKEAMDRGTTVLAEAQRFASIATVERRDEAILYVRNVCKPAVAFVDKLLGDETKKAHQLHKTLVAKSKALKAPFIEAKSVVNLGVTAYEDEQRRIRAEEQRRLEAEHRKIEDERRRLQQEAEAKARQEAEDKRMAEAAELEKQGHAEAAAQVLEAPVVVEAPVVDLPEIPNPVVIPAQKAMVGATTRTTWKFRITSEAAVSREYLMVDEKRLGVVVRALKGDTNIPGIEPYSETTTAIR